jgi:hypothetical protein
MTPKSLSEGIRITEINNLREMSPRSPLIYEGNKYFMGAGRGLPNGGPELIIDSIFIKK